MLSSPKAKRFIEALCAEKDLVGCIQNVLSSPHGISALQQSLRVDITISFMRTSLATLLQYLQNPELVAACNGDLLHTILRHMVEPPVFWDHFVAHVQEQSLDSATLQCFAWMLLRLLSIPDLTHGPFIKIASDTTIKDVLDNAESPDTRNLNQKIQILVQMLTASLPIVVNGPGGRHDNDFADYRKIAILPSIDELISSDAPYLRFASDIDDVEPSGRLVAQLDNQFRLLREDMLHDLKEELAGQTKRAGLRIDGLRLTGVAHDNRNCWAIELACLNGLSFMPKKSDPDDREQYLKKYRKILAHGSLACIFADGTFIGLATVWRRESFLSQDVPLLHLHLPSNVTAIRRTLTKLRGDPKTEVRLLNTAVFAYEPILKQLQNTNYLSLAAGIMDWESLQSVPIVRNLKSMGTQLQKLDQNSSMDLQNVLALDKSVMLDDSQARSLVAGLTQQIAIIQGPPGTGKSFIGALIARALHRHTTSKILVLSYTNHALDQYLEDLLNIGIPAKDIVRLGSAAKATPSTKPLVLMDQIQSKGFKLTRNDWELIKSRESLSDGIGVQLVSAFQEYVQSSVAKQDLMDYLEFSEYSEYFDAFQFDQADGYRVVDDKGRAASEFYLLERWLKNEGPTDAIPQTRELPSIWSQPKVEREKLRRQWLDDILKERLDRILEYGPRYDSGVQSALKVRNESGRRLMQNMRVIGCTTTAAAKYVNDIQSAAPDIVIVEEAGEILESHILAALGPSTKQLILIGDHKQLRPKAHYDLSVEKGTGYDLNRSLFERLVLKGYPHQTLSQQHRMRPEISALIRNMTYPELTDAPGTMNRAAMRGFQSSVVFVAHDSLETEGVHAYDPRDGGSTASKTNDFEAEMTLKCVKYLAQQGYRSNQIVVLTPYLGQLRLLYDVLRTENDPVLNDLDSYDLVKAGLMPKSNTNVDKTQLRISTVDNYQGEECDIVVVSLTRSNKRGDIGFMSSPERLNVLLSRARDGIIMMGNPETFLCARKGQEMWKTFFDMLQSGHYVYQGFPVRCERHKHKQAILSSPGAFDSYCPEGGCDNPCTVMLSCGVHTCPSRCHQLYDHSKMPCKSIVSDVCTFGHKISWRCCDQRPSMCQTCYQKKKRDEVNQRKAHEKLVAESMSRQQHEDKMEDLDAQIETERERIKALNLQNDRQRAHQQKLADLKQAKENVKQATQVRSAAPPAHAKFSPQATSSPGSKNKPSSLPETTKDNVVALNGSTISPTAKQWNRMKSVEGKSNEALEDLMQMTGLEEVKSRFISILDKVETVQRQGNDLKQERLGTVFLGNPGTGKTTVARIYAKFLSELQAIPGSQFIETTGAKLSNYGVTGTQKMVEDVIEAGGGAIFIDEAYQLVSGNSYGGGAVLDYLLAEIENTRGKIVFMFAGYEKQMEKFFEHNPGLASRMPYQLTFADYSESELLCMLVRMIEKRYSNRMRIEDGHSGLYMRIAIRRLHRTSGREGFGNARALENILGKITSAQSERLACERRGGLQTNDFLLTKDDLIGPEPEGALQRSQAWAKLQKMVGLDSIKSAVCTLLDRLKVNYARELKEKPPIEVSLNRLFLGSPGTGKTTVAKLYGQILADIGMLSTSECVLKTPSDFIGSVMGESEKNTKAILDNTRGKVLVIDEAYMFWSASTANDPYRQAVVDTIVSEVHSTPGDDRAVLLLGYEEQMRDMLRKVNPGLTRRFPIDDAFFFEDYNDEQLMSILNHKLTSQGLCATEQAKTTAIELLAKLRRRPNFGNAGEVEILLSRAKDSESRRQIPGHEEDDVILEPQDFDPDFGRSKNALERCRLLFQDVVGSEEVVDKLTGYVQSFTSAQEIDCDPMDVVPFNFVFKGPPGKWDVVTYSAHTKCFQELARPQQRGR